MNTRSNSKRQVGLIFGKFYPLHNGHIYLIEKAKSQVDELHVFLGCEATRDLKLFESSRMPKQPMVKDRFYWLQKTFKDRHNIHIHILDEAGIAYYPNGWKDWSDRVKLILSNHNVTPTVIFTSEPQDVENHELHYHCPVKLIDADRNFINISATQIRNNPYQNWSFIAKSARPFFVKRVALISHYREFDELMKQLSNVYDTTCVSNGYVNYIKNEYLRNAGHGLDDNQYIGIAQLHAQRIEEASILANRVLFTSLDFQTLHHYYQQSFHQENKILRNLEDNYHFDLIINSNSFSPNDSDLDIFDAAIKQVEQLLI